MIKCDYWTRYGLRDAGKAIPIRRYVGLPSLSDIKTAARYSVTNFANRFVLYKTFTYSSCSSCDRTCTANVWQDFSFNFL